MTIFSPSHNTRGVGEVFVKWWYLSGSRGNSPPHVRVQCHDPSCQCHTHTHNQPQQTRRIFHQVTDWLRNPSQPSLWPRASLVGAKQSSERR